MSNTDVQDTMCSLLGLPLLPAHDICQAVADIKLAVNSNNRFASKLHDLLRYIGRQWINKLTIGPECLCVLDNQNRTNNIPESFHAALRQRIQMTHLNLFTFLGHMQHMSTDSINNMVQLRNGLNNSCANHEL